MKKVLCVLLVCLLTFSMAACGTNGDNTNSSSAIEANTLGTKLQKAFHEADTSASAADLADVLVTNEAIEFMGATMEVEEGFLNGFSSEISGFSEGAFFGPMIGSIPFAGYVFKVKDDVKVDDFMKTLKDNADLRWNICTEADEMIVDNADNTVFFLMCLANGEE